MFLDNSSVKFQSMEVRIGVSETSEQPFDCKKYLTNIACGLLIDGSHQTGYKSRLE